MTTRNQQLPPFSGDNPTCPICGYAGVITIYRAIGKCLHDPDDIQVNTYPNPRLHRQCAVCDYLWDEAVMNQ